MFRTINDLTNTRPGYIHQEFTLTASGASTDIRFRILNVRGFQSLDNVSVVAVPAAASVPEPTSLALAGLALAGLGFCARRKRAA